MRGLAREIDSRSGVLAAARNEVATASGTAGASAVDGAAADNINDDAGEADSVEAVLCLTDFLAYTSARPEYSDRMAALDFEAAGGGRARRAGMRRERLWRGAWWGRCKLWEQ